MSYKPAQPQIEHLLVIEDDKGRKEMLLKDARYVLGRARECHIHLNSQFVSRSHATLLRLMREDGTEYYRIVDGLPEGKSSANGILVNGRKVHYHDLQDGDQVVFGPQVFIVYQHRQRDLFPTIPPEDPFDITLIDPAMMEIEPED